jgi:hypothetical protein
MREDLYRSQFLGCNTGAVFVVNMIDDPNDPGFANASRGCAVTSAAPTRPGASRPIPTRSTRLVFSLPKQVAVRATAATC